MIHTSHQPNLRGPRRWLRESIQFWYGFEPPHALCVFRILFGLFSLVFWLQSLPYVPLYYSNHGMAFPLFEAPEELTWTMQSLLAAATQPPSVEIAWIIYAATLACVVLFTIGFLARSALWMYFVLFLYYYVLHIHVREASFDKLMIMITGLLALSRCDVLFAVSSRRRQDKCVPLVPAWPGRLIGLQTVLMYFGAGVFKLTAPDWSRGEMLYYTLISDWGTELGYWFARTFPWLGLYDLMVPAVLVLELTAPLLFYSRTWRWIAIPSGALFHVAIAVSLSLWPFLFMPLTYVLLVDARYFAGLCHRVHDFLAPGLRPSPASVTSVKGPAPTPNAE